MFRTRARHTRPSTASLPATGPLTPDSRHVDDVGTPHHVPDWLMQWTLPTITPERLPSLLCQIHHRLVTAAATGPGLVQYLEAANVIRKLSPTLLLSYAHRVRDEFHDSALNCLTTVLNVLREWDTSTSPHRVHSRFALAYAWADHVELVVDNGRSAGTAFDIPTTAPATPR